MSTIIYHFIKKILFLLEPECSHKLVLNSLYYLNKIGLLKLFFNNKKSNINPYVVNINKKIILTFKNKLGLAAGLDKNAQYLDALSKLGFGFIEVGTVTPRAQLGNPKPRLFRLKNHQAIINRMGFNNHGVDNLINNVMNFRKNNPSSDLILGINIGKNSDTPIEKIENIEKIVDDYLYCMEKAYNHCEYISINISSPNTIGLRDLQKSEYLNVLLEKIKAKQLELELKYNKYTPVAIKISPDLLLTELQELCLLIIKHKIDMIIVTNTTVEHELLYDQNKNKIQGGLSGAPISAKSNSVLQEVKNIFSQHNELNNIIIIGVGGINSKEDAKEKINCGADLVQVYTGLVYQGLTLIDDIVNYI